MATRVLIPNAWTDLQRDERVADDWDHQAADEMQWYRQGDDYAPESDSATVDAAQATESEPQMGLEQSSSSSSPTSSTSSSESSHNEEGTADRAGVARYYEVDEPVWQHRRSRMLHRPAGKKSDGKTKCGRRTENAYVWLEGALSA